MLAFTISTEVAPITLVYNGMGFKV